MRVSLTVNGAFSLPALADKARLRLLSKGNFAKDTKVYCRSEDAAIAMLRETHLSVAHVLCGWMQEIRLEEVDWLV